MWREETSNVIVVVVKPLLSICFELIFVRAILCLKLKVAAGLVRGGGGRRSSSG